MKTDEMIKVDCACGCGQQKEMKLTDYKYRRFTLLQTSFYINGHQKYNAFSRSRKK